MFSVDINGISLTFETKPSLFSPNAADRGTLAMLNTIDAYYDALSDAASGEAAGPDPSNAGVKKSPGLLLDLGCGYGLAGIYLAKRYAEATTHMSDSDPVAVACARANAARNHVTSEVFLSDGLQDIPSTGYTLILSNPPYHVDFAVAKRFIEKGFNRLAVGGVMFMVTKRREWYKRKMITIFGGVSVTETDGYFIFKAEKRGWLRGASKGHKA